MPAKVKPKAAAAAPKKASPKKSSGNFLSSIFSGFSHTVDSVKKTATSTVRKVTSTLVQNAARNISSAVSNATSAAGKAISKATDSFAGSLTTFAKNVSSTLNNISGKSPTKLNSNNTPRTSSGIQALKWQRYAKIEKNIDKDPFSATILAGASGVANSFTFGLINNKFVTNNNPSLKDYNTISSYAMSKHPVAAGVGTVIGSLPYMAIGADEADEAINGAKAAKNTSNITDELGDYDTVLKNSIHNPNADKAMLGKFEHEGSPTNYISKAGNDHTYFSMGDNWGKVKSQYNYTDNDMFDAFNKPYLDQQISQGKTINFSHDPIHANGALKDEYNYLTKNGYAYNPKTMSASPIK